MRAYHDREWGTPRHDDRALFEFLILEGMQAGLSWDTILKKRGRFRRAFSHFNPRAVARYARRDVRRLMRDPGIIRNRAKIAAAIVNAQKFLEVAREFGSFDRYLWGFVGRKPIAHRMRTVRQIPTQTAISVAMSKDLRRRGFRFAGPTICYALMQAVGMVNDHTVGCFRRAHLLKMARRQSTVAARTAAGSATTRGRRRGSPRQ